MSIFCSKINDIVKYLPFVCHLIQVQIIVFVMLQFVIFFAHGLGLVLTSILYFFSLCISMIIENKSAVEQ